MPRSASIELDWADGTYTFRLAWAQIEKLQEATDAGPMVVLRRLFNGDWNLKDISETIRWGLVGGGMTPADALKLIRLYVEDRPPAENVLVAQAILGAGIHGTNDETPGELKGEAATDLTTSPTAKSDLPTSTEPAL